MQMAQVQPITVAEWLAELTERGLSPSRVRQSYRLFSQLMSAAVDNDVLTLSPCRKVRLPKMPETEPTILTVAQVEALATATRAPHDMLVYLLAYGGLRIGEAFALRREHVDLLHGRLIVAEAVTEISGRLTFGTTKAHQQRVVALPAFLTDRLAAHLDELVGPEPRALLFTGRTGKAQHYNSWRRFVFDPVAATAGLPGVTPHDLRATCATRVAADQGVMEAAKRLGHSRASVTTRHYARAVDGRDADVAAHLDEIRRAATARPVARGNLQASR
jgi:integrase